MQRASVLCAVAAVLSSSGCSLLRERNYTAGGKVNDAGRADVQRVADRFNANSRQIQSILCDQVVIDGRAQGQPYTLDAQIAFEKPSNFRLRGRAFGHNQADLGSNGREIWCYIPQATDHKVLFCKREELGRVNLPIPFQPDWLAEALGIMEINPAAYGPSGDNGSLAVQLRTLQKIAEDSTDKLDSVVVEVTHTIDTAGLSARATELIDGWNGSSSIFESMFANKDMTDDNREMMRLIGEFVESIGDVAPQVLILRKGAGTDKKNDLYLDVFNGTLAELEALAQGLSG